MNSEAEQSPPPEVWELYDKFEQSQRRAIWAATPAVAVVGFSSVIAGKIFLGHDQFWADLYSQLPVQFAHGAGILTSLSGLVFASTKTEGSTKPELARQIAEIEGRSYQPPRVQVDFVETVIRWADEVNPRGANLFFERLRVRGYSLYDWVRNTLKVDEDNQRMFRVNTTIFESAIRPEADIMDRAAQLSAYRWRKVALNPKESLHMRRYAFELAQKFDKYSIQFQDQQKNLNGI